MFDWIKRLFAPKQPSPYGTETQHPAPPADPQAIKALNALVQPAIAFEVTDSPSTTYTGGTPNLGENFSWPAKGGKPLNFLAQVDLGQIAIHIPDSPLPKTGILSFFYDHDGEQVWGSDPKDAGAWQVVFSQLQAPTPVPAEVRRISTVNLAPVRFLCYPGSESLHLEGIPNIESLEPYWDDLVPERQEPQLQLLGYPLPVQNDQIEEECAMASAGINSADFQQFTSPTTLAAKANARDWILLAQFNSRDSQEVCFGDAGMLYYWIRKQDLESLNFNNVWLILQCY